MKWCLKQMSVICLIVLIVSLGISATGEPQLEERSIVEYSSVADSSDPSALSKAASYVLVDGLMGYLRFWAFSEIFNAIGWRGGDAVTLSVESLEAIREIFIEELTNAFSAEDLKDAESYLDDVSDYNVPLELTAEVASDLQTFASRGNQVLGQLELYGMTTVQMYQYVAAATLAVYLQEHLVWKEVEGEDSSNAIISLNTVSIRAEAYHQYLQSVTEEYNEAVTYGDVTWRMFQRDALLSLGCGYCFDVEGYENPDNPAYPEEEMECPINTIAINFGGGPVCPEDYMIGNNNIPWINSSSMDEAKQAREDLITENFELVFGSDYEANMNAFMKISQGNYGYGF